MHTYAHEHKHTHAHEHKHTHNTHNTHNTCMYPRTHTRALTRTRTHAQKRSRTHAHAHAHMHINTTYFIILTLLLPRHRRSLKPHKRAFCTRMSTPRRNFAKWRRTSCAVWIPPAAPTCHLCHGWYMPLPIKNFYQKNLSIHINTHMHHTDTHTQTVLVFVCVCVFVCVRMALSLILILLHTDTRCSLSGAEGGFGRQRSHAVGRGGHHPRAHCGAWCICL